MGCRDGRFRALGGIKPRFQRQARLGLYRGFLHRNFSLQKMIGKFLIFSEVLGTASRVWNREMLWKSLVGGIIAVLASLAVPSLARAHPHVWVKVRSQISFTPEGKVLGLIQDWTFDEEYSAFAVQGLAKDGHLADREDFKPMATENGAALAQINFYTTLKIGGKPAAFINATDYWMEERPDHLVV